MARFDKVPRGQLLHLSLLGTRFVGDLAQEFAEWLVSNQEVRFTTSEFACQTRLPFAVPLPW